MRFPPTACLCFSQLSAFGHDGSDGRTRRAEGFANGSVAFAGIGRYLQTIGQTGIFAKRLKKLLRFIRRYLGQPARLAWTETSR
jgi:hypothetical protein